MIGTSPPLIFCSRKRAARLIDASGERLRYNARQVRRGALLAAPDAAAPRLIEAFRRATGCRPI